MAAYCMKSALKLAELFADEPNIMEELINKLLYEEDLKRIKTVAQKLQPTIAQGALVEQFDGYFKLEDCSLDTVRGRVLDPREYWGTNHGVAAHTQIIKQADVIAMMALFPKLFTDETVEENWRFYEPRTEHGSSLSACMYALTACRINRADIAWEHFMRTASIDLTGGGKHWAGEIYIGGTHPAANGGAWMIAVLGFAGLSVQNGELKLNPRLPKEITSLRFPVMLSGNRLIVTVTHDGWDVKEDT
jgi:trehalose/maltose hydrolase-like predicted phosphorylase